MYYTLDRIEENSTAVFTDDEGRVYNEDITNLPSDIHAGDVFICENGVYKPAAEETAERKKRIKEKRDNFFNKLKKKQEET